MIDNMIKNNQQYDGKDKSIVIGLLVVIIYLLLYFSHFPFLSADADLSMASGRGAWADEGCYTCQIRNYINHNRTDMLRFDTILKAPVFSFFLMLPFRMFGTSLETARIAVLSFVMLMILLFAIRKNHRLAGIILALTTLGLAPVYHHTHLSLADMISIALILIGGLSFSLFIEKKGISFLLYSYVFLSGAALFKIQFLYVLFIPLLSIAIYLLITKKSVFSRELLVSLACPAAIFLLLYAFLYLPLKYEWSVTMLQQAGISTGRPFSYLYIKNNLTNYFLTKNSLPFTISFLMAFVLAVYNLVKLKFKPHTAGVVLFAAAWFIMELHKLMMNYLPIRYMLGIYFSMGLLTSVVFAHYLAAKKNKMIKAVVVMCILSLLSGNLMKYVNAIDNRQFTILNMNEYLAEHAEKDDVVIGPWAPALTWKSKNVSFPVESDFSFRKNEDILKTYKPQIIISEPDEADSNQAYKKRGIDLNAISDSSGQFRIALWNLKIYWLREDRLYE